MNMYTSKDTIACPEGKSAIMPKQSSDDSEADCSDSSSDGCTWKNTISLGYFTTYRPHPLHAPGINGCLTGRCACQVRLRMKIYNINNPND